MSGSLVNRTVPASESPKPHGTDVVAPTILETLRMKPKDKLVGRTFDMKAAYKQLALSESSLWAAFVAVFNPVERKPEIYQLLAAPFGATRSVFSFLRVAGSIWFVGAAALSILWTCFFDDYVAIAPAGLEANTLQAVTMLFKLLGWAIAEDGSKASAFSETMSALGICFDFSQSLGVVLFSNTEKRVWLILASSFWTKEMTVLEAQRLRGRMQFADGQLFGRVGSLCMRALTKHAFEDGAGRMSDQCAHALKRFSESLRTSAPRMIKAESSRTWYVFTDACFEPKSSLPFCGIGGALIDSDGNLEPDWSQLGLIGSQELPTHRFFRMFFFQHGIAFWSRSIAVKLWLNIGFPISLADYISYFGMVSSWVF